jgi:glycosyltransferase involved in cell wall biosynthesis
LAPHKAQHQSGSNHFMKITFVMEHACMSGGTRVIAIHAERLKRMGHDVLVVTTPRKRISFKSKVGKWVGGYGWPRQYLNEPSHLDAVDVPHHVLRKYRPVDDRDVPDADVVIATWWETAEWVNALSPSKGAKAYFIQHHELLFENQPADRVAATWRMPLHKITISKWLTDLALHHYGDEFVSHVPNSVETAQFHAPPRDKQKIPTVGFLYNPTPFKGCRVAIDAIERAREKIGPLRVISFGNFPVSSELPLPSDSQYILRPAQDQIRNIYAACDVWICGSRSEGFHLPPLEAMACRCPVVSTRVGGSMDIIRDGINGYLVDVDDSATLANRLVEVLQSSPAQWLAMSNAAHARAHRYSWDDAARLMEASLEIAIRRSRGNRVPQNHYSLLPSDYFSEVCDANVSPQN